jgi:hypothetical protein
MLGRRSDCAAADEAHGGAARLTVNEYEIALLGERGLEMLAQDTKLSLAPDQCEREIRR